MLLFWAPKLADNRLIISQFYFPCATNVPQSAKISAKTSKYMGRQMLNRSLITPKN